MTAAATNDQNVQEFAATENRTPLPLRGDTLLGVCEAIGQDLGFSPNWLRLAFAGLLMWNAEAVVVAYLCLGVVVAASRWFFPVRARKQVRPAGQAPQAMVELDSENPELLAA